MKKVSFLFLVIVMLLSTVGCGNMNAVDNAKPTEKETINFDLSQYKDHGNLSDGCIWVIKETASWDTDPYESYAYLDCDGNVIYGWHSVGTYYNNGFYDCRATRPQDFKNGFALIYDQSGVDKLGGYVEATIIDKKGKVVAEFLIDAYESRNQIHMDYEHFNSQGYAFFIGKENYGDKKGMFFVNDSGVHRFQCNENSYIAGHTLECIDLVNDKYLYVSWCNYQLFDLNGNLVMDIGESSEVSPDSIEIIDDKYIEATFTGKDDKVYICVIDFNGNFIKSPVLKSDYVRKEEDLAKIDVNSLLGTWIWDEVDYREDTFVISEKNIIWTTKYRSGQSESSTLSYNDSEFYDAYGKFPYKFENGKIVLTLQDGSITLKRKG